MKRKKKKQDKKRKTMKHKKDTNLCKNQEKSRNKFSCLVNDFYSMVQNCLKEQMNRKLPKADQKKKMKQVIYHLNKMNNLILNSETLNEFKLHIDATNIVTFGGVIAPCVQMCLEMNNQEQNALYNIVKRTIILKTFSMLFMPCFLATYKSATSSSDDYKSKYMEITNDNDIDKEYHQRNNVLNLLQTKFYFSKDNFKLCRSCFLNQILSRLAWSCFQTFDPFYSSLLNETNYQVFLKNTIFYHMTYNNSTECDVNMYYEKHCNDVMKHNEWNSIGYLTDENSGKYFINKNLYGLIKDWSWIYYLRINKANNFVLIDSIIDESAINYFNTLIIGQTDNINGLLFQINWQENEPCYHCSDTTIIKCFNETDFVRLIPRIKKHTNRVKYDNIRICNEPNQKSRNSRKSQFHNSLYKSAKNKFSSKNNNEYIRMYKKNEKRKAEGILLKRIQSDGALNRKKELYYENLIPSVKRLKRNTSLPTIDDHTEISLPLIHHNENEKTHYKKKFRKQNLTSYRKCLSDQLPFTGYERIICSGDEPKKEINFKHQNSPNKLKKMLTKKKSKFVEKESIKSSGLNEQSCKHSCNLQ
ncbi:uncharacterized protein LOC142320928 [Lycorma delicatula]|uniref:uncharacterized protein LOC142320928 n=1 Tax=Lycorma delicatula TaxID=130591 RepID=UPI003F51089F